MGVVSVAAAVTTSASPSANPPASNIQPLGSYETASINNDSSLNQATVVAFGAASPTVGGSNTMSMPTGTGASATASGNSFSSDGTLGGASG